MLEKLLEVLNGTGYPFKAYRWDHRPAAPYGTAQFEGGADSVAADDMIIHQGIRASVDLYAPNALLLPSHGAKCAKWGFCLAT